jgi:hypothetical protein
MQTQKRTPVMLVTCETFHLGSWLKAHYEHTFHAGDLRDVHLEMIPLKVLFLSNILSMLGDLRHYMLCVISPLRLSRLRFTGDPRDLQLAAGAAVYREG